MNKQIRARCSSTRDEFQNLIRRGHKERASFGNCSKAEVTIDTNVWVVHQPGLVSAASLRSSKVVGLDVRVKGEGPRLCLGHVSWIDGAKSDLIHKASLGAVRCLQEDVVAQTCLVGGRYYVVFGVVDLGKKPRGERGDGVLHVDQNVDDVA